MGMIPLRSSLQIGGQFCSAGCRHWLSCPVRPPAPTTDRRKANHICWPPEALLSGFRALAGCEVVRYTVKCM